MQSTAGGDSEDHGGRTRSHSPRGPWAEAMGTHSPSPHLPTPHGPPPPRVPLPLPLFPPCFLLGCGYDSPCVSETCEKGQDGLGGHSEMSTLLRVDRRDGSDHLPDGGAPVADSLMHCLQKKSRQQFTPTRGVLEGLPQCLTSLPPHPFKH